MSLLLEIDAVAWRSRLRRLTAPTDDAVTIVPVGKGNGYGLGLTSLAREAAELGSPTLAIGLTEEISQVQPAFDRDVLVMNPTADTTLAVAEGSQEVSGERVIHTVSRLADLRQVAASGRRPRIVVELLTSMHRHGIPVGQLSEVVPLLGDVRFEGWALHLPLTSSPLTEATALSQAALAADVPMAPIWVSHLSRDEAATLAASIGTEVRLRTGTDLWLGDRSLLHPRATVLDAHAVGRGAALGYRQVRPGAGTVLVVSGGTANGVGLVAPAAADSMRSRAAMLARAGLEATGRIRSPYRFGGRQLDYVEPPHMQSSMLWWPFSAGTAPAIGATLDLDVRFTTTHFDDVRLS